MSVSTGSVKALISSKNKEYTVITDIKIETGTESKALAVFFFHYGYFFGFYTDKSSSSSIIWDLSGLDMTDYLLSNLIDYLLSIFNLSVTPA